MIEKTSWNEDVLVETLDNLGDFADNDDCAMALKRLARTLPQYLWFYQGG